MSDFGFIACSQGPFCKEDLKDAVDELKAEVQEEKVGTDAYCSPRHQMHSEPSFMEEGGRREGVKKRRRRRGRRRRIAGGGG
jgi:hypothetical protein